MYFELHEQYAGFLDMLLHRCPKKLKRLVSSSESEDETHNLGLGSFYLTITETITETVVSPIRTKTVARRKEHLTLSLHTMVLVKGLGETLPLAPLGAF